MASEARIEPGIQCDRDDVCLLSRGHDGECEYAPMPMPEPQLPAVTLASGLPFADPVSLKGQLDRYTATRRVFLDWIANELRAGTDYMVIHRKLGRGQDKRDCPNKQDTKSPRCNACGGKATLCKPGAEKIAGLLQLTPRFRRDVETLEMVRNVDGLVALVCELVNATGQSVAEGRGARAVTQDFGDVNKTIKMAEKSAQIDATLRLAGLSEVFTQDLEDAPAGARDDDGARTFTPPRRASEVKPPQQQPQVLLCATHNCRADECADLDHDPPGYQHPDVDQAPGAEPSKPKDALSEGKIRVVYAKVHAALRAVGKDNQVTQGLVLDELDRLAQEGGRPTWKAASFKDFNAICDAIGPIVAKVAGKGHARMVRR